MLMPKLKLLRYIFLLFVGLVGLAFLYVRSSNKPPKERELVENFYAHRAAYERLRDMLQTDENVLRVAAWGIETTDSVGVRIPPDGGLSISRYNEYLALLRQTGGKWAFRGRGTQTVGVGVWTSGWGGDTRHVELCWTEPQPSNQIPSLDEYYRSATRPRRVFRHIVENWYLWADW